MGRPKGSKNKPKEGMRNPVVEEPKGKPKPEEPKPEVPVQPEAPKRFSSINTSTMHTKFSIWTFNDKENKWYGVCRECKGDPKKQEKCSLCHTPETED